MSMMSVQELFYGNMQPTWITRQEQDNYHSGYPYTIHNVEVIELRVPQCCKTKCATKIKNRLYSIKGVSQVIVDHHNQKVTVTGTAGEEKILKEIKRIKKRATLYYRKQYGQV